MSRLKKLASETAVYGLSSVFGRLINVALVPLYVNVFAESEYGVVSLIYVAVVFLNILFTYGMESSYLKFASGSEGRPRKSRVFSTVTWSLVGTALVMGLVLLSFRGPVSWLMQIQESRFYLMYLVVPIVALDAITAIPFAELRLQNKAIWFAVVKLINIGINVGLNLYFILVRQMGIESIFIANLIASAVNLLLLSPIYLQNLRPVFDRGLSRQFLSFGLPFIPGGVAYVIAERFNYYFLARMGKDKIEELYGGVIDFAGLNARAAAETGLDVNLLFGQYIVGIFSGIWKLSIAMMLVSQMFKFAWQPFFLQHAEDPDAKGLFARVFGLFNVGGMTVALAVAFFAAEIVAIPLPFGDATLIKSTYWPALPIVPFALLAYLFQGWYYNFTVGVYIEKKTKYLVHSTVVGAVVSVVANALLVPSYGMLGAVWATMLAFLAIAVTLLALTRRFYEVPYPWPFVVLLAVLAGGIYALWYFNSGLQVWWVELLLVVGFALVGGVLARRVLEGTAGSHGGH